MLHQDSLLSQPHVPLLLLSLQVLHIHVLHCVVHLLIFEISVSFMYVNVGSWLRFHNLAIIRNNLIDSADQQSIIFRSISLQDSIRNPFFIFHL